MFSELDDGSIGAYHAIGIEDLLVDIAPLGNGGVKAEHFDGGKNCGESCDGHILSLKQLFKFVNIFFDFLSEALCAILRAF